MKQVVCDFAKKFVVIILRFTAGVRYAGSTQRSCNFEEFLPQGRERTGRLSERTGVDKKQNLFISKSKKNLTYEGMIYNMLLVIKCLLITFVMFMTY